MTANTEHERVITTSATGTTYTIERLCPQRDNPDLVCGIQEVDHFGQPRTGIVICHPHGEVLGTVTDQLPPNDRSEATVTPPPTDYEDIARLTGDCYQKWVQDDSLTDEEVLAGAEYTQNVIRDLRFFGPSFRHARSELIRFSWAMRTAHRYRQTLAPNDAP